MREYSKDVFLGETALKRSEGEKTHEDTLRNISGCVSEDTCANNYYTDSTGPSAASIAAVTSALVYRPLRCCLSGYRDFWAVRAAVVDTAARGGLAPIFYPSFDVAEIARVLRSQNPDLGSELGRGTIPA